jgi:hypothetical protein
MTGKRLAGFIAVLLMASSSSASPVTWGFEGYVTVIAAEPDTVLALSSLGVAPGSPFSGRLVFESATLDADADPAVGSYPGAISLFEVTIGGYHTASEFDGDNGMVVSVDEFAVGPYGLVRASAIGPGATGLFADPLLRLDLPGSPLYPIYGDELSSLLPPGLVEYDHDELFMAGIDGNIYGNVTHIEVVPEPGLATLVALSAVALAAIRLRVR